MRFLGVFLFLLFVTHADEHIVLKVKNGLQQDFVKAQKHSHQARALNPQEQIYYLHGIESKQTKYITSREIFISFGKKSSVNYEAFAQENHLQFLYEVNKLYHTGLFKDNSSKDIIEVANSFNALKGVRFAQPNFKRYREVR